LIYPVGLMANHGELEERILSAMRRIIRAIDLHSRELVRVHRITGPQLVTLRAIAAQGSISVSALARAVNLSQPTVTGILVRLEREGFIRRERSAHDRRTVVSVITPRGLEVIRRMPPLLQDRFLQELERLSDWEQTAILSALQRIASMMDADALPAEPVLATEPLPSADEMDRDRDLALREGSRPRRAPRRKH